MWKAAFGLARVELAAGRRDSARDHAARAERELLARMAAMPAGVSLTMVERDLAGVRATLVSLDVPAVEATKT